MKRPKIRITLIDQKGTVGCHRGHKIGDSYDFDTERGNLCPMAMHVAFPYVDILRYGGNIPGQKEGTALPVRMWIHSMYLRLNELTKMHNSLKLELGTKGDFLCKRMI